MTEDVLRERWNRVRHRAAGAGADAILLAGGPDLAYLTGYEAMPLERITAFVGLIGEATGPPWLIVPAFEIPRVESKPGLYEIVGWDDTTDPVEVIAGCLPEAGTVLVSDDLWAMHVINLGLHASRLTLEPLGSTLGGLRSIKAATEMATIAAAGALADEVARQLQDGSIPLVGRSEAAVAADIGKRLLAVGHDSVEFVIVASGPNSASPHHDPGGRVIERGEMVLCDFGGKLDGYCSDTTRCVWTGRPPAEVRAAYDALHAAQERAVQAVQPGKPLCNVDLAARNVLRASGYDEFFIHRTGHGIGTEVHEHPYVTEHNAAPIEIGHAFSVEPGIYFPGRWGMRIEDIVVVKPGGGHRCNHIKPRIGRSVSTPDDGLNVAGGPFPPTRRDCGNAIGAPADPLLEIGEHAVELVEAWLQQGPAGRLSLRTGIGGPFERPRRRQRWAPLRHAVRGPGHTARESPSGGAPTRPPREGSAAPRIPFGGRPVSAASRRASGADAAPSGHAAGRPADAKTRRSSRRRR